MLGVLQNPPRVRPGKMHCSGLLPKDHWQSFGDVGVACLQARWVSRHSAQMRFRQFFARHLEKVELMANRDVQRLKRLKRLEIGITLLRVTLRPLSAAGHLPSPS